MNKKNRNPEQTKKPFFRMHA